MSIDFDTVKELLHDATFAGFAVTPDGRNVRLRAQCLQRNLDGSEPADPAVEFALDGVSAVGFSFGVRDPGVRPSSLDLPSGMDALDVVMHKASGEFVYLDHNEPAMAEEALESPGLSWLFGDQAAFSGSAHRVVFTIEDVPVRSDERYSANVLVGAAELQILSGTTPLTLEEWGAQFAAWWKSWEEHWSDDEGDEFGEEFDAAIPLGDSPPPDLSYAPPREPVCTLEPHDAPDELLRPIVAWFEGHHAQNWPRMAAAHPRAGTTEAERADELAGEFTTIDFGHWGICGWLRNGGSRTTPRRSRCAGSSTICLSMTTCRRISNRSGHSDCVVAGTDGSSLRSVRAGRATAPRKPSPPRKSRGWKRGDRAQCDDRAGIVILSCPVTRSACMIETIGESVRTPERQDIGIAASGTRAAPAYASRGHLHRGLG